MTENQGQGTVTCPNCGEQVLAGSRFCPACGRSLQAVETPPWATPAAPAQPAAGFPAAPAPDQGASAPIAPAPVYGQPQDFGQPPAYPTPQAQLPASAYPPPQGYGQAPTYPPAPGFTPPPASPYSQPQGYGQPPAFQAPQGQPPSEYPQPQGYGAVPGYPGGYGAAPARTRRNSLPIIVGIGVVGLVLVLIAGVLVVAGGGKHATPAPSTVANVSQTPAASRAATPVAATIGPATPSSAPTVVVTHGPVGFSSTGSMSVGRWGATATTLTDGRVLVTGGYTAADNGSVASAELYDPATGTFTATGSMTAARSIQTATLLNDGRVLIVGGHGDNDAPAAAELFNPQTGTFTKTGALATVRWGHTATLLKDGRVLIAGGNTRVGTSDFKAIATAEIYDPKTGKFSPAGPMVNALVWHTATLLYDGRVLLAGGEYGSGSSTYPSAAQLFDPATNTFSATGSLATNRSGHAAVAIPDGRVLVLGGSNSSGDLASAELYSPNTGSFEPADTLTTARQFPTATVLPNGNILVSGGSHWDGSAYTYYASVEIFDTTIGSFSSGGSMTSPRERHQAVVLPDGRVLLVGGEDNSGAIDSAELYQP